MGLSDKVKDSDLPIVRLLSRINLKEKVYFWTAQTNAIMFPLSLLYAAFGDNPKAGAIATGINASLAYGFVYALQRSYKKRHGENAMTVGYNPNITFGRDGRF